MNSIYLGGCLTQDLIKLRCALVPKSALPVQRGQSSSGTGSVEGVEDFPSLCFFMQLAEALQSGRQNSTFSFAYKGTNSERRHSFPEVTVLKGAKLGFELASLWTQKPEVDPHLEL